MNILVINCGSSSLKYQLININTEEVLAKGLVERIGIEGSRIKHEVPNKDKVVKEEAMEDHKHALSLVLKALTDEEHGAVKSLDEIQAVGHRVVHGGESFTSSVIIDDAVMKALNDNVEIAPLHNPPNIMGIEAIKELMPSTKMVAVFDTAFHQTMPAVNYLYALPYDLYEEHKVRRYGFHGTSHKYVTERAAKMLGKDVKDVNLITCHLGNGSSITCVEGGKSKDTSMGFTPLEGVPMGTRSGNIDPAIVTYVMEKRGLDVAAMNNLLNKESGVYGVSGVSSDFRDLEDAAAEKNERAQLALDMFEQGVRKFIGAYFTELDHVDAIVFTAGVGENGVETRENIVKGLKSLGVALDTEKNNVRGKEVDVTAEGSTTKVLVIPTNEELMIAKETYELVK